MSEWPRFVGVMQFRNQSIEALLLNRPLDGEALQPDEDLPTESQCDVVYALFLEPSVTADPNISWGEYAIDKAIRWGQTTPTLIHCELLIPPIPKEEGDRTQLATYYGRKSGWQSDHVDGFGYYLVEHAHQWRALPIFAHDAANRARAEANKELGVSYSLSRYITSVQPLRYVAKYFVPNGRRKPAHCATLLARVLRNAFPEGDLDEVSAYYGPTSLHAAVQKQAMCVVGTTAEQAAQPLSYYTEDAIQGLLRRPMCHQNVAELGDDNCMDAVRALTVRVSDAIASGDADAQRLTQRELATALLRWTILRNPVLESVGV